MDLQKLELIDTLWHTEAATLCGFFTDDNGFICGDSPIDRDQALADGDSGEPCYPEYSLTLEIWDGWDGFPQDDDYPRDIRVSFNADEMREFAASWYQRRTKN